jgi:predicted helicase
MSKGFIYLRHHENYEKHNIYKLGRTRDFLNRDSTYSTGEFIRGKFIFGIEILKDNPEYINDNFVEKLLQRYFNKYHKMHDGGTEFYDKKILDEIELFLNKTNIKFKILTRKEIYNINMNIRRQIVIDKLDKNIKLREFLMKKNKKIIIPNEHQQQILNKINKFYEINNIGKILWSCGLGKTLLSILICKKLNYSKILIGVPSVYLQKQFINEILKVFPNKNNILCVGGNNFNSTTEQTEILKFLNDNKNGVKFIITTYTSCHLLLNEIIDFDFKIGDEAHHLVGLDNEEITGYKKFHNIKSKKTLFMTATEKTIETKTDKIIYSMNDELVFGKLIDEKTVHWAIENKKITDYRLLLITNTESEINNIINKLEIHIDNKELFMSAFVTLKSIEQYNNLTHILICCNTTDNSEIVNSYIKILLEKNIVKINKNDVYSNALHSNKKININLEDPNNEIEKFKKSKYGIISSVYIFGEGFDLPKLNGVVFSENMESDIRIVQTALRPNRLDLSNPEKISYIVIPHIETNNISKNGASVNKVRMIIRKLRNVDDTIEQKMILSSIKKYEKKEDENDFEEVNSFKIKDDEIDELNKIKIKLKYSKILSSDNSEELDEYNYIQILNKELKIQSKEEYSSDKIKSQHSNYIDNADEYFTKNGVWKSWYDFIGLDTNKFIKSKEEWKEFCIKLGINSLEKYKEESEKYDCLPKSPVDFYQEFTNIPLELGFHIKRRNN